MKLVSFYVSVISLCFGITSIVISSIAISNSPTESTSTTIIREEVNETSPFIVGEIRMYVGEEAPEGWLLCDGAEYDQLDYQELYLLYEDAFDAIASSPGFFRVPDFRGRSPLGAGTGEYKESGIGFDHLSENAFVPKALGEMLGAEYPSGYLVTTDDPTSDDPDDTIPAVQEVDAYGSSSLSDTYSSRNVEGGNYHPYTAVNFIIKT